MANNLETWYNNIPIITRTYLTLCAVTSFAVTFDILSPYQLYLNFALIFRSSQYWRLLSNFLFFDRFNLNFFFHIYFLYFYCRRLEENSFHGKSSDFLYMMLFGCTLMLFVAPLFDLPFLSQSLIMLLLYIWSRRNPLERLRLYGLFTIGAAYLPYIFLALTFMLGGNPIVDIVGILVGHLYYFFADIVPYEFGFNLLQTPFFIKWIFPNEMPNPLE